MTRFRVNLGCGIHVAPGWVNLDSSFRVWLDRIPLLPTLFGYQRRFPRGVRRFDVRRPLPLQNGSADFVYSSHLIEHLRRNETEELLAECRRVLVPGGRIRLVTPNLKRNVDSYVHRRSDPQLRDTAADHFLRCLGIFEDPGEGANIATRVVRFLQRKNAHKWLYDESNLASMLRAAGFKDVTCRENWVSDFPDLNLVETADRRESSVCAEGTR